MPFSVRYVSYHYNTYILYTANSIASAEKTLQKYFTRVINTQNNARRGFLIDQWPKSGIAGAFVAKIGYLSISVFAYSSPHKHSDVLR